MHCLPKTGHAFLKLGLLILTIVFTTQATAAYKYIHEGMKIEDFSGTDLVTGEKISFDELRKENLPIIVFWATWSPRSLTQLAELKEILANYEGEPIKIIAINVDAPKLSSITRQKIDEYVGNLAPPYPVIIDEGLEIFYRFGVIAVPSTAISDTTGILRYGPGGYALSTRDIIIDSIEAFLGLIPPELVKLPEGYTPKKKSARFYSLALGLFKKRMYEQVLSNLDQAEEADKKFAAPLALRGEVLLLLDRLNEADSVYKVAAELDSGSVVIWAGWGRTLLKADKPEAAMEKLQKAISLDESYTPAFLDLGLSLARMDSLDAAIDSITIAIELNPGDPFSHYYLGRVNRMSGRNGEAAESFLTALKIIYPPD
jgi:tetratricopeptide (TPR) repeat protein